MQGKKKSGLADSLQLLPAAGQARSLRQNNSTSLLERAGRIGIDRNTHDLRVGRIIAEHTGGLVHATLIVTRPAPPDLLLKVSP